jgi:predicted nucleic acid-binding protein
VKVRRCLLDLNVVLDVVLDRPEAPAAAQVWRALETGVARGFVAAHAVTTLFYVVARARGRVFAREALEIFLGAFQIAPVDGRVLKQALSMAWPDFEDAVTASVAAAARCDLLVTRDPGGFKGSPVRVLDPRSAAALLRADESPTDA